MTIQPTQPTSTMATLFTLPVNAMQRALAAARASLKQLSSPHSDTPTEIIEQVTVAQAHIRGLESLLESMHTQQSYAESAIADDAQAAKDTQTARSIRWQRTLDLTRLTTTIMDECQYLFALYAATRGKHVTKSRTEVTEMVSSGPTNDRGNDSVQDDVSSVDSGHEQLRFSDSGGQSIISESQADEMFVLDDDQQVPDEELSSDCLYDQADHSDSKQFTSPRSDTPESEERVSTPITSQASSPSGMMRYGASYLLEFQSTDTTEGDYEQDKCNSSWSLDQLVVGGDKSPQAWQKSYPTPSRLRNVSKCQQNSKDGDSRNKQISIVEASTCDTDQLLNLAVVTDSITGIQSQQQSEALELQQTFHVSENSGVQIPQQGDCGSHVHQQNKGQENDQQQDYKMACTIPSQDNSIRESTQLRGGALGCTTQDEVFNIDGEKVDAFSARCANGGATAKVSSLHGNGNSSDDNLDTTDQDRRFPRKHPTYRSSNAKNKRIVAGAAVPRLAMFNFCHPDEFQNLCKQDENNTQHAWQGLETVMEENEQESFKDKVQASEPQNGGSVYQQAGEVNVQELSGQYIKECTNTKHVHNSSDKEENHEHHQQQEQMLVLQIELLKLKLQEYEVQLQGNECDGKNYQSDHKQDSTATEGKSGVSSCSHIDIHDATDDMKLPIVSSGSQLQIEDSSVASSSRKLAASCTTVHGLSDKSYSNQNVGGTQLDSEIEDLNSYNSKDANAAQKQTTHHTVQVQLDDTPGGTVCNGLTKPKVSGGQTARRVFESVIQHSLQHTNRVWNSQRDQWQSVVNELEEKLQLLRSGQLIRSPAKRQIARQPDHMGSLPYSHVTLASPQSLHKGQACTTQHQSIDPALEAAKLMQTLKNQLKPAKKQSSSPEQSVSRLPYEQLSNRHGGLCLAQLKGSPLRKHLNFGTQQQQMSQSQSCMGRAASTSKTSAPQRSCSNSNSNRNYHPDSTWGHVPLLGAQMNGIERSATAGRRAACSVRSFRTRASKGARSVSKHGFGTRQTNRRAAPTFQSSCKNSAFGVVLRRTRARAVAMGQVDTTNSSSNQSNEKENCDNGCGNGAGSGIYVKRLRKAAPRKSVTTNRSGSSRDMEELLTVLAHRKSGVKEYVACGQN